MMGKRISTLSYRASVLTAYSSMCYCSDYTNSLGSSEDMGRGHCPASLALSRCAWAKHILYT